MTQKLFQYPIKKISFIFIAIITLIITLLIGGNKICIQNKCLFNNDPHVKEFSWEGAKIGANDTSFTLTFNKEMNHESVEKNLIIEPPLPGKISWKDKSLIYTLDDTISYGKNYRLSLLEAKAKLKANNKESANIEPFVSEFQSRDRAFAYIGIEGEEKGKLILYNSTKENQTILTPEDLTVVDFKFSSNGKYIFFLATKKGQGIDGLRFLKLYKVSTGISPNGETEIPAEIELILDNKDYQNNEFDLAGENGEIIAIQRINRKNPADVDLWLIQPEKTPEPLHIQGGDFLITPNGKNVAIAQGEGIAIIPLEKGAKPLDFFPKYGKVLDFAQNDTGAVMVNFNKNEPSLVYVKNKGIEKELLDIQGSITDCKFDNSGNHLYCLLTKFIEQKNQILEENYFALIDIKTTKVFLLVALSNSQDIKLSLAPDNFGILFDQLIMSKNTEATEEEEDLVTDSAEPIIGSSLWLLTLPSSLSPNPNLEELPIAGLNPQWSP